MTFDEWWEGYKATRPDVATRAAEVHASLMLCVETPDRGHEWGEYVREMTGRPPYVRP